MKTPQELIEDVGALSTRVEEIATQFAATQTAHKAASDGVSALTEKLGTLETQLAAILTRLTSVEPLAAKLEDGTRRLAALETREKDFEKRLATEISRLGISSASGSASAAAGTPVAQTPEALQAAMNGEKDPLRFAALANAYWKATAPQAAQ